MMDAVRSVYGKHATFSGRATRSEFWWFILSYFVVSLGILAGAGSTIGSIAVIALVVIAVGSIIPSIAVAVRRLHDTGRSGWWLLVSLIPFGGFVLLYFYLQASKPDNQFGPAPMGQMA